MIYRLRNFGPKQSRGPWDPDSEKMFHILPLYAYSSALAIVIISVSIVFAQFSTSPSSFKDWLKFSIKDIHCVVCFDNFATFDCNCFASDSNFLWLLYAASTLKEIFHSKSSNLLLFLFYAKL